MKISTRQFKNVLGVIGYIVVVALLIGFAVILHYAGNDLDEYLEELELGCLERGGIFKNQGEIAKKCEDYDEEGYVFYWRVNQNGDWYKSK